METPITAEPISRLIGTTAINICTRIMGLILAACSIDFITVGLVRLPPGLAWNLETRPIADAAPIRSRRH